MKLYICCLVFVGVAAFYCYRDAYNAGYAAAERDAWVVSLNSRINENPCLKQGEYLDADDVLLGGVLRER